MGAILCKYGIVNSLRANAAIYPMMLRKMTPDGAISTDKVKPIWMIKCRRRGFGLDSEAATKLVTDNIRLAPWAAMKFRATYQSLRFDDLLSDCFELLWTSALAYDPRRGCGFASWYWLTVWSTLYNRHIRNKHRPASLDVYLRAGFDFADTRDDYLKIEREDELAIVLSRIPIRQAALLTDYYLNQMTQNEIARKHGVRQAAVSQWIKKALHSARETMED